MKARSSPSLLLIAVLLASCASSPSPTRAVTSAGAVTGLRDIDWSNMTVPASVCGTPDDLVVEDGLAYEPVLEGFIRVDEPVQYGDLDGDGVDEAAVPVNCEVPRARNFLLVYRGDPEGPGLVGTIATTQPDAPEGLGPFFDNARTRIEAGTVTVDELWYEETGEPDGCCPTSVATTAWAYDGGQLAAGATSVAPFQRPKVRPEDFVGEWSVHGGALRITSVHEAVESFSNVGSCTDDPDVFCAASRDLRLSASPDGQSLLATVEKVTFFTWDEVIVDPPPDLRPDLGADTFRLEFVFPDLLKTTAVPTSGSAQGEEGGNPYYCGHHLPLPVVYACGA